MNWDQIEGNWQQLKGKMKQQWGKLTDDDFDVIDGKREEMLGKIQERYGIARDRPSASSTTSATACKGDRAEAKTAPQVSFAPPPSPRGWGSAEPQSPARLDLPHSPPPSEVRLGSLSPTLRVVCAIALLLLALVELVRFVSLAAGPSLYAPATYAALALLAGLSGVGLWRRATWAPAAILALGGVFAATRLVDALLLGIRPWLFALLAAVAALVAASLLASWARADARLLR